MDGYTNYRGVLRVLEEMEWGGKEEFKRRAYKNITSGERVIGRGKK